MKEEPVWLHLTKTLRQQVDWSDTCQFCIHKDGQDLD